MTYQLKPCPFCGGEAEMCEGVSYGNYVTCTDCGTCLGAPAGVRSEVNGDFDGIGDASRAWNTRTDPWQPIETAPKDGTRILTCKMMPGATRIRCPEVNEWNDPSKSGLGSLGWWKSTALTAPTHWMPLPEPPKDAGQ